jgi:hypothetical protein
VGIAMGLAVGGLAAVNRWLLPWKTDVSGGVVAAVAAMVTTFFALMLAFAIVNLYQSYQDAGNNARAEANSLSEIFRDSLAFPAAAQARVQRSIADYVVEVQTQEFPLMRAGELDPTADPKLTAIFQALQTFSPRGQTAISFYNSAVAQLNQVVAERENRVNSADASLPGAFVSLLLFTGLLSICTTFFFRCDVRGLEYTLVAAVAAVVGVGLLTTLLLEYPFSGSVSIPSTVYSQGYLGHIVALYLAAPIRLRHQPPPPAASRPPGRHLMVR